MTSRQSIKAIFRCNCFHLLKHTLNYCKENFEKYFTAEQNAILDANSWILQPFHLDSITETKDLIDLQSDFGMKALFKETP